jgi:hypothetical protein
MLSAARRLFSLENSVPIPRARCLSGVREIFFIGDVVGAPGRKAVQQLVPKLRAEHGIHFVIANGENSAGGSGITPATAGELFGATLAPGGITI